MSNTINIFTRSIGIPEGTINQAAMTTYEIIATILAVIALIQPWMHHILLHTKVWFMLFNIHLPVKCWRQAPHKFVALF